MTAISKVLQPLGRSAKTSRHLDIARPDLRRMRSYNCSAYSDAELRQRLDSLALRCQGGPVEEIIAQVFAVVDETVSRRLGAWRLFDPEARKGALTRYEHMAQKILESSPHRNSPDFYTDPDFLESIRFRASIEPLIDAMGLDRAEQTVVETMVYVAEKSKVDYWPNVHLPASFYQALAAVDVDDAVRFAVTEEQLLAGLLLYEGVIVEMNAGEGKTIAAAFPAVLNALKGASVHVITANDYLAARDADWLAPVYESLGFSVGAVLGYMGDEERRHAYRQQIVYGTLREFGFDYLRDNLRLPPDHPVQGALEVAIVDEADHVLIDQARTPLIISGAPGANRRAFERIRRTVEEMVGLQARLAREAEAKLENTTTDPGQRNLALARLLLTDPDSRFLRDYFARAPKSYDRILTQIDDDEFGQDDGALTHDLYYAVDPRLRSVTLTERGQNVLENRLGAIFDASEVESELASIDLVSDGPLSERRKRRSQLERRLSRRANQVNQIYQMLRAYVLVKKDVDYVVADSQVVLVDELTGRTLPDSRYQHGLHVAVEAKEGVVVRPEGVTLAQVSVQGFLKQYSRISGMTGTALGSSDEFRREYGLRVLQVPPAQPLRRADLETRLYASRDEKLAAIVDATKACHRVGRPALVGTLTIEQSQEISSLLAQHGIAHNLLNAVSCAAEAEIVKTAGAWGAVTIATNMAGRGTDIILDKGTDSKIVEGYLDLVQEHLGEGVARVELACATSEEADVLWEAMSACDGLTVTRDRSLVAVSRRAGDGSGGTVRLECGLGMYVIGTEMNRSERIDRQLRGRSGRQGAYGASRFFLSLEDRLLAYRGADLSGASRRPAFDSSGRACREGQGVQRGLDAMQRLIEQEEEVQRAITHEYYRVLESQTLAYYRARQNVLAIDSFERACEDFVSEWATRQVNHFFPEFPCSDYWTRYDMMAEELWEDFKIDCRGLDGTPPDRIADDIAGLLLARLEQVKARLGGAEFTELGKLLLLRMSDELWQDHMAELHEVVLSVPLGLHDHRTAMADLAIRGFDAYHRFKEEVMDVFLPKLLAFPDKAAVEDPEEEPIFVEDVARILL